MFKSGDLVVAYYPDRGLDVYRNGIGLFKTQKESKNSNSLCPQSFDGKYFSLKIENKPMFVLEVQKCYRQDTLSIKVLGTNGISGWLIFELNMAKAGWGIKKIK